MTRAEYGGGISLNTLGERQGFLISRPVCSAIARYLLQHEDPQKLRTMHVEVNRFLQEKGLPELELKEDAFGREVALLFAMGIVTGEQGMIYQLTPEGREATGDLFSL